MILALARMCTKGAFERIDHLRSSEVVSGGRVGEGQHGNVRGGSGNHQDRKPGDPAGKGSFQHGRPPSMRDLSMGGGALPGV
jgi:hypothetical protein